MLLFCVYKDCEARKGRCEAKKQPGAVSAAVCVSASAKASRASLVIRSMKRRSTSVLLFLCLLGLRGSKRALRSKETAGGCFGGRVRVGERESEPSESRNPLHEKEEALRCFFFCVYKDCEARKGRCKAKKQPGAVSAAACVSASVKASRASLVIRSTRKKGTATPFLFNFNLFSFSAVLISGRIISYPYMAFFSLPSRAYSPALRGQLKVRFPAPHPLWCCLRR